MYEQHRIIAASRSGDRELRDLMLYVTHVYEYFISEKRCTLRYPIGYLCDGDLDLDQACYYGFWLIVFMPRRIPER